MSTWIIISNDVDADRPRHQGEDRECPKPLSLRLSRTLHVEIDDLDADRPEWVLAFTGLSVRQFHKLVRGCRWAGR